MKKNYLNLILALLTLGFVSCEDVPAPYELNPNSGSGGSGSENGIALPYSSSNLYTGWNLYAVTADQPWSQGNTYTQATGYQKWDGADAKSNKEVEGYLISPAFNTLGLENVKIVFDHTIRYTNNVSDWVSRHKIFASKDYDGKDFTAATWTEVPFTPEASPYTDWTLYSSGEIQIPAEFANSANVYIAFKFSAPASASTTWELQNFQLLEGVAEGGGVTPPADGSLPYTSANLNTGWTMQALKNQPWSQGNTYAQATGYQKWDGASEKSNREVEGYLISPAFNTTNAENVKISFDNTIRYTNNVSGWESYHKIYASKDYDGTNFNTATWTEVTFTPVSSPYNDWTLYSSGEIQLPAEFANVSSVYVAFYFYAPETGSTTWELKNFKIEEGIAQGGGDTPPSAEAQFGVKKEIVEGDYVIAAKSGKFKIAEAFTGTKTYGYLNVSDATPVNNVISTSSATAVWTIKAVSGGYTIQDNQGRYLYMKDDYNNFNIDATMPSTGAVWNISFNENGTANIVNVEKQKTIQYSAQYSSYGSYADVQYILPYLFLKDATADMTIDLGAGDDPGDEPGGGGQGVEGNTIDFSAMGYSNQQDFNGVAIKVGDATITFSKGTNSTTPKYYTTGNAMRMYGSNTMTVSSTKTIKSVKIVYGEDYNGTSYYATAENSEVSAGTYDYETHTWTLDATSGVLTRTATGGHFRIVSVTFEY